MEKPLGKKRENMGQFGTGVVNAVSEDDGAVLSRQRQCLYVEEGQVCLLSSIVGPSPSKINSARLTSHSKRLGFPKLSWNKPHSTCRHHLVFTSPVGTGVQGPDTNADPLATARNGKLSFASEPGISCLLPATVNTWQPVSLACKEGRILDP